LSTEVYLFIELSAIFILVGWGIYLVFRLGQLYNMPVFSMSLGAYFTGVALREFGWPFGLTIFVAVAIGALVSFVVALALARASPFAMAIASMAPIIILQSVVRNVDYLGGLRGFVGIPSVDYLMPLTFTAMLLVGLFIYRLDHSRIGRAIETVLVDADVAASQGINKYRLSIFLQTAAGAMGALAGAIYAPLMGSLTPSDAGFPLLLTIYSFLFIGGPTTMWGVVVFTPLLWGLRLILPGNIASWLMIIYGSLLVIIVLLRPDGVITKQMLRSIRVNSQVLLERVRHLCK